MLQHLYLPYRLGVATLLAERQPYGEELLFFIGNYSPGPAYRSPESAIWMAIRGIEVLVGHGPQVAGDAAVGPGELCLAEPA